MSGEINSSELVGGDTGKAETREMTPEQRLSVAKAWLKVAHRTVEAHNAATGQNGDLGSLLEATDEAVKAREALGEVNS